MNPIVVIGALVGVAAVGYAAWTFLRPAKLIERDDDDGDIFDVIDQNGADPTKCKRTGRRYNPDIWKGPKAVKVGLNLIGYPVSGNLITTSNKALIGEAQREFARRELPSHKGLDHQSEDYSKGGDGNWFDGTVGACTLNDLEIAVEMKRDGKW